MLQESFDKATESYKARVGNRQAWSDFYEWLYLNLKNIPENEESKADIDGVFVYIAKDPELLVRVTLPWIRHDFRA